MSKKELEQVEATETEKLYTADNDMLFPWRYVGGCANSDEAAVFNLACEHLGMIDCIKITLDQLDSHTIFNSYKEKEDEYAMAGVVKMLDIMQDNMSFIVSHF